MEEPDTASESYPSYAGQYLIATPSLGDSRFRRSVIYLCSHDRSGAMGLVVNRAKLGLQISDLLEHVGVSGEVRVADSAVLDGGPVDIDRGFVLHSPDWSRPPTLKISDATALTSTRDVMESLVADDAPARAVLAVGYAGWGAGQLEAEIADNAWLVCAGDSALVFGDDLSGKWAEALSRIGVRPEQLGIGGSA